MLNLYLKVSVHYDMSVVSVHHGCAGHVQQYKYPAIIGSYVLRLDTSFLPLHMIFFFSLLICLVLGWKSCGNGTYRMGFCISMLNLLVDGI